MRTKSSVVALAVLLGLASPPVVARADGVTVPMRLITDQGEGAPIGFVRAEDSPAGLRLTPELAGLPPGPHGFHVHEKPSCQAADKDGRMTPGLAAGGHYDPQHSGKHLGPTGEGHQGDLPALDVAADGTAKTPVTAPRLKVADIKGRSLMIHAGGDTYSDEPPMGGGGARIACGIVPE